ncbi:glutathione peroxidase [Sandarakinorhabdus oryzae]|uniref:glutathione peroxidase n=1 Tax=Sandarakinorhabdus oryzae TaxID=2675220 RepID=UPI0012E2BAA3|nr:glutathione peroxidase [Sandarakinorhabdus oryzae]
MTSVYEFSAKTIDGREVSMKDFEGKVLLIVNTASKCGFTPQYEGLEALHRTYGPKGFAVLGFPCNQFGAQEPGNAEEIANFCKLKYDVDFPLFAKIDVNGPTAHPLFQLLKRQAPGFLGSEPIKWNFTKFLVDKHGQVQERFAPTTRPEALGSQIESLLAKA